MKQYPGGVYSNYMKKTYILIPFVKPYDVPARYAEKNGAEEDETCPALVVHDTKTKKES